MLNNPTFAAGSSDAVFLRLQQALQPAYILEEQIGAGAMGMVFKAHDVELNRAVAIKVLREDLSRSMGAERFEREILTVARLTHPHIVSVLRRGSADGMLYFVMPYLPGESLRAYLTRQGALPVEEAMRITTQLTGALRHAHAAGVVHRDIKPENILLMDGNALLADFGVARAAVDAGDGYQTTTGLIIGSPQYISPEQLRNQQVDGRADIYALGCVLYEMLSGQPPFAGKSLEATLFAHMTQPPPPLNIQSKKLERVLDRALAKLPEDRFASAEAFERALADERVGIRVPRKIRRLVVSASAAITIVALVTSFDVQDWLPPLTTKPV